MGKGQTSWTSSWSTLACVTRSTAPRDITIWGLRPPCLIIVRWRPNNPTNTHPEGGGGKKGLSRGRLLPPRPALFPPARGPRPRRAVSARRAPRSAARARPPARPPAAGPALRPPTGPALAARSRRPPPAARHPGQPRALHGCSGVGLVPARGAHRPDQRHPCAEPARYRGPGLP